MSSTIFETAAIIRLVDELSGPLHALEAKVAAHQSRAMAGAQRLQGVGRAMAFGVSLPIEEAFRHMSNSALEFSKVENTLQGVLTNRARTMGLSTEAAGQWVKSQKEILDVQTKLAVQRGHGLVNPLEFAKGAMSGTKAGLDMEAATAAAETATRLALAGRIKQHEALDMAITAGNQFGVQFKDENGVQFAADKITAQYAKIGDLLTTMATNANMTLTQAAESVSLSAPIARAIGMDPGVLGAMSETQAEAGFKGKEASVAQRSLLMALTAPKSTAIPAFKSAGINYFDYATFKPEALLQTTPEGFEQYAKNKGLKISHADTVEAFKSARDEAGPNGKIQSYLGDYIVGVLKRSGSKESPVTPDLAMKYANNYLTQGVDKINVPGLIQAIRAAGMTLGQLKGVVEPRQIPRLLPFLRDPNQAHSNADLTKEAVKEYGKNWQTKVPELKQYLDSHKDGSKKN